MVVKAGLKPTNNLLLLRDIVYRMIHFNKQFPILLEISSDLLITLSPGDVPGRRDALASSQYKKAYLFTLGKQYRVMVSSLIRQQLSGIGYGIRTRVTTVKGWCPRPLDQPDTWRLVRDLNALPPK